MGMKRFRSGGPDEHILAVLVQRLEHDKSIASYSRLACYTHDTYATCVDVEILPPDSVAPNPNVERRRIFGNIADLIESLLRSTPFKISYYTLPQSCNLNSSLDFSSSTRAHSSLLTPLT